METRLEILKTNKAHLERAYSEIISSVIKLDVEAINLLVETKNLNKEIKRIEEVK